MVLVVNIPASVGLVFLSRPIIALIYEHGRFKASDTLATANALIFYALGLFAYSGIKVLVPAFYALGRSRVPVIISSISVVANIGLNLWLIGPLGYLGLALGTSLTAIANFLLLFKRLQTLAGPLATIEIATLWIKMVGASIVMGAVSMKVHLWLAPAGTNMSLAIEAAVLALSIGLGMATLYLVCRLMRIEEIEIVSGALKRKFGGILGRS